MKKLIFSLVICGLFSLSGFSQVKFGVEGGVNFMNYSQNNSDIIASSMETGWLAGVKCKISGDTWYGQLETYYQRYGSVITSRNLTIPTNGIVSGYFSWENIQVPLTIGAYLIKNENSKLRAFAGLDVAFKMLVNTPNNFNVTTANVKRANWGGRFGVGIDFWERITFDVLYNIGFLEIFTHSQGAFRSLNLVLGVDIN